MVPKFLTFEELVRDHERLVAEVEKLKQDFEGHVHDGGSGMVGVTTGPAKTWDDVRLDRRNKLVAIEELKKLSVSDPEKFMRCKWCGLEKPKCSSGICDDCCPF